MKKFLIVFGTFILFFFTIATLFKLMHWPGAAVLFTFSLLLFSACFIPLFFIQRIIENKSGLSIVTNIFGMLTTSMMFVGILFKIMHWPGASLMIVFGTLLFIFPTLILYVIQQFKEYDRKFSEFWKMIFLTILASVFILFWGVSVSKNILVSYLNVEDATLTTNKNIKEYNTYILDQIKASDSVNASLINAAQNIHGQSLEMILYTEGIKKELIGLLESDPEALNNHWLINSKDNYDAPTRFLGEYDSPKGKELFEKLNTYRETLKKRLVADPLIDNKDLGDLGIDTSIKPDMTSGYEMQWNESVFYSQTMVGALALLSSIQNQILNAEFKSLSIISKSLK